MKNELSPHEVVKQLNRYIIGQDEAKRAVAIALRNRYRRAQLPEEMREEITPKNILMIGPTGVGKTEIARRLAKLVEAPFIKVEATKFTEVGYVGRDVESIIRDLTENAVRMVHDEYAAKVRTRAQVLAEDRLLNMLSGIQKKNSSPFDFLLGRNNAGAQPQQTDEEKQALARRKDDLRDQLRRGELENQEIEIEVEEQAPQLEVGGASINIGDMMGGMMPKRTKMRRVKVHEARDILIAQESDKLIDEDAVREEAVRRTEQSGIVFLDEIDKVAGHGGGSGPDVSREGVQRDILPIVEGSTVNTKYGAVRTDFMLFIAAGAFHVSKVTDLIPELQGRFPVHVRLKSLTEEDFVNILTKTDNALTRQYSALLEVDHVHLTFDEAALREIARITLMENESHEDLGARRLHAIFEELLEDVSFNAGGGDAPDVYLTITEQYVKDHLKAEKTLDTKKYIL